MADVIRALMRSKHDPKVSKLTGWGSCWAATMEVDTNSQVSVIREEDAVGLQMSHPSCLAVSDFSGKVSMKILGEVNVPILGVPTTFCVVEGYQGPAILGQNFLCMPGVTLTSDELALEGRGSLPLERYHYSQGLAVAVKAVKSQPAEGPQGQEPIAED
eukprot:1103912-Lingulodinium_polyedra.AAC.1